MSLLTPVANRWYTRLNEATLFSGLLILVGYTLVELIFTNLQSVMPIRISPISAGLSAIAVVYGAIGFRFLSGKMSVVAGLISYLLLSASVGTLVHSTGGLESQYLLLWAVVILFSAMFGWLTLVLTWMATHVYFMLVLTGAVESIYGTPADIGRALVYLISLELPFVISFFLWYGQGNNQTDGPIAAENVGAGDISQGMLISSIAEGVVVIDDQQRIQVFNPAATDTTGWKETDARGIDYRTVLSLLDEKGKPVLVENDPIAQVFNTTQTVVNNDVRMRSHNNKILELSLVASPITNANGGVSAVVAVFRDVSEERGQERQRAEFISTASHEMRTPVAAIEGYLALALNDGVSKIDSKAREYLTKAHQSTQHLGKLFQDLLTAAKTEDGRLDFHPQVLEVGAFLDQLADAVRFAAMKKGLVMEYQSGNAEPGSSVVGVQVVRPLYYAHFDAERVREVITNLFDNAVKYTTEGKITVALTGDDNNVTIKVSDTGPGIAAEDIPHLFQKFYRVDNSETRQIGGTGLGLFIARKIVEKSGGKIWVESQVGQGSSFYVSLPRLRADQAEELKRKEAVAETPLAHVTGNVEL